MTLLRLLPFISTYQTALAVAGLGMVVEAAIALAIPALGGRFAGSILAPSTHGVNEILLWLLAVFTLQAIIKFLNAYLVGRISENILANLRIRIYEHLQALPLSFFESRRHGDIIALVTNDVSRLSGFITGPLLTTFPMALTLVGGLMQMFRIDVRLAILAALLVPLFVALMKNIGRRLRLLSNKLQEEQATAVAIFEENISMLPVIKAFTRETLEAQRHKNQVLQVRTLSMGQQRIYAALEPGVQLIAAVGTVLFLWLASSRMMGGELGPSDLVAFLLYVGLLTRPLSSLASIYGQTQIVDGALERLECVLGEKAEATRNAGHAFGRVRGDIEYLNLHFGYPGRPPIIKNLNWRIHRGETVALTGQNGAGKSTLVHLLMRLHEPTSGAILIDDIDIADANLSSLRRQIGIVSQQVLLFNGTVQDNIRYGKPDASTEAIETAARAAQAHDFISQLPAGYETVIGDNGVRLSGGQRQRISLARALLKDPPILVLDEATAMFDPDGERSFIEEARDVLSGRTVILITHRPASLQLADRVVVMDNGAIC